jgi:hypothetical protein
VLQEHSEEGFAHDRNIVPKASIPRLPDNSDFTLRRYDMS